jgi:cytoskeletal protein CcmA (bactofilin family)
MLGKPEATPSPSAPQQARRFTDSLDPHATVIGPATRVKGELVADGPVDLAGTLEGEARVTGHCRIREKAIVKGRVEATTLVVEGQVEGPGLVAEKIEIGAGARVRSNIEARIVAIADGAFFEGTVHMDEPGAPVTFKEKRGPRP